MLRVHVSGKHSDVKKYFTSALAIGDDYYGKSRHEGVWGGKLKNKLGLGETVQKEQFFALVDNLNPQTGERLTARTRADRIVGFDITFNCPKSVSIAYALNKDEEILIAFKKSVDETMQEIEESAMTRVRKGGADTNRVTGNMVWSRYIHETARPEKKNGEADLLPDMSLHAHAYCHNVTFDKSEGMYKALNNVSFKSEAPYYEAAFHARFTNRLKALGYGIEKRGNYFEIAGVTREMIDKFSTRTKKIEEVAKSKGITNPKEKAELAAKTRKGKGEELPMDQLAVRWLSHLSTEEKQLLSQLKNFNGDSGTSAREALAYAIEHGFERNSVLTQKKLLTEAMRYGYGSCTPAEIWKEFNRNKEILKTEKDQKVHVTTKEVLAQEQDIIEYAKSTRGRVAPINLDFEIKSDFLNKQQTRAVKHALTSVDGVVLIEGGAGTGKTTLFQEVKPNVEAAGKTLFAFAPSSKASREVMRSEGFTNADTIQSLLSSRLTQNKVREQVIWVDEAGLLSVPQTQKLFQIAKEKRAKVILSGDSKQHSSVEKGSAFQIIQEHSGLKRTSVREIIRQKIEQYKHVVNFIQTGKIEKAFDLLEKNNQIVEIANKEERHDALVGGYIKSVKEHQSALVIAPTHREGDEVSEAIRQALKKTGKVGVEDRSFEQQQNLNFTEAQKRDWRNYHPGQAVQFFQNARSFKAGDKYNVVSSKDGTVTVVGPDSKPRELRLDNETKRFQVFNLREIKIAKGDMVRVTSNGWSKDRKHLYNGNIYRVTGFNEAGEIILNGGSPLRKDFRNLSHAYVSTSHASQGTTTDKVIIAQSSTSFKAGSQAQLYVSISRGKYDVKLFTDDLKGLKESVKGSAARLSATELLDKSKGKERSKLRDMVQKVVQSKPQGVTWRPPSTGKGI